MRLALMGLMLSAGFLAGCVTAQTAQGNPGPFPEGYEKLVRSWLKANLKDPYSLRDLTIGRPVKENLWRGLVFGGNLPSWKLCTVYNAKNSFGAYIGIKSYAFYMRYNEIVSVNQEPCVPARRSPIEDSKPAGKPI